MTRPMRTCTTCGAPTVAANNGTFRAIPPLRIARNYTDLEIRQQATASQVQWLYDNPLLWLRALQQIKRDIDNHIAKDRTNLSHLKPGKGETVSNDYLAAKRRHDQSTTGRLHFTRRVEARIEEVASLVNPLPMGREMAGDTIKFLIKVVALAEDDDIEAVKRALLYQVERLSKAGAHPNLQETR